MKFRQTMVTMYEFEEESKSVLCKREVRDGCKKNSQKMFVRYLHKREINAMERKCKKEWFGRVGSSGVAKNRRKINFLYAIRAKASYQDCNLIQRH